MSLSRLGRWVAGVRLSLAAYRYLTEAFDRFDERRACGRRERLGRRWWLLSWQREGRGLWMARLSGPEVMDTIERSGLTRCAAITRSTRAMKQNLSIRAQVDQDNEGWSTSPP